MTDESHTESWRVGAVVAAGTVHNTLAYRYYPLLLPGGVTCPT